MYNTSASCRLMNVRMYMVKYYRSCGSLELFPTLGNAQNCLNITGSIEKPLRGFRFNVHHAAAIFAK